MTIHLLQWDKALSIAQENGDDNLLDIVLWQRVHYLESHREKEQLSSFKEQLLARGVISDDHVHRLEELFSKHKFHARVKKNHEEDPFETKVDY